MVVPCVVVGNAVVVVPVIGRPQLSVATGAVRTTLHSAVTVGSCGGIGGIVTPTFTVAIIGVPVHVPETGVMVNVTVTGALVVLVSIPLTSPDPLAGMP